MNDDGTLPFEELKAEIDSFVDLADDEYVGTIGRLMRSFEYTTLDSSVWYIGIRYKLLAVYLYRTLDKTKELFDLLLDLLKSRDKAIYEKLKSYVCEV